MSIYLVTGRAVELRLMLDQKLFIELEPTKHCIYSADKDRLKKLVLWKGGGRSGNGRKGRKKELLRELTTFVIGKRNEEEAGAKYFLRLHRHRRR